MNRLLRLIIALLGLGLTAAYWSFVGLGMAFYAKGDCINAFPGGCAPEQLRWAGAILIAATLVYGFGVHLWRGIDRAVRRLRF